MKFVFDWHSQDSRASGPLNVANTVTAQYGTGGEHAACGAGMYEHNRQICGGLRCKKWQLE